MAKNEQYEMPDIEKVVEYAKIDWINRIRIFNPIYTRTLEIFWGNVEEFKIWYKKPLKWVKLKRLKECNWMFIRDNKGSSNLIWINDLTRNTVIHEIQHCIFYRYSEVCLNIDIKNDATQEFFTHSMNFCLKSIHKTPLAKKLIWDC